MAWWRLAGWGPWVVDKRHLDNGLNRSGRVRLRPVGLFEQELCWW